MMRQGVRWACMAESNAVPDFLPSTHGLRFANRFPPGPTVRLGPIDPRWIGIGDASAGLCGGMAWYVRERFEAGQPIPTDRRRRRTAHRSSGRSSVDRCARSTGFGRRCASGGWARSASSGRPGDARESNGPASAPTSMPGGSCAGRSGAARRPEPVGDDPEPPGPGLRLRGRWRRRSTLRIYDPNWPGRDDVR